MDFNGVNLSSTERKESIDHTRNWEAWVMLIIKAIELRDPKEMSKLLGELGKLQCGIISAYSEAALDSMWARHKFFETRRGEFAEELEKQARLQMIFGFGKKPTMLCEIANEKAWAELKKFQDEEHKVLGRFKNELVELVQETYGRILDVINRLIPPTQQNDYKALLSKHLLDFNHRNGR